MIRTIEGIIDEYGNVRLLEPVQLPEACRALVTILDERPAAQVAGTAFLSESALRQDWDRPAEDDAWAHLQPTR